MNAMNKKGSASSRRKAKGYTISAVADYYGVHQQTLRLYEREGLLKPSRSVGNVRLYTDEDLERLEVILQLTREMGVNLAGVEIILNLRERMERMQQEFNRFFEMLRDYAEQNRDDDPGRGRRAAEALVPVRSNPGARPQSRPGLREYDGGDD